MKLSATPTYDVLRRSSGWYAFVCPRCNEIVERRSPKIASRIAGEHYDRHEVVA